MALPFPEIDPVAIQLGPLAIRWYALAYIAGIVLGWRLIGWLDKKQPQSMLSKKQLDDMIMWGVFGVVLGGRLGYVLFYNLEYFVANPADIFKTWQGGMSFHGGALGVILGFYLFAHLQKIPYLRLMDLVCCAVPIGLFLGRLSNFANGELYGRVTDASWGVVFPHGGSLPRHPSQLYEAALEGAVLFIVLFYLARYTKALQRPGFIGGAFLAGYGVSRFLVEFVREPDEHLGLLALGMSMGQWLCVPMMLVGAGFMVWSWRRNC